MTAGAYLAGLQELILDHSYLYALLDSLKAAQQLRRLVLNSNINLPDAATLAQLTSLSELAFYHVTRGDEATNYNPEHPDGMHYMNIITLLELVDSEEGAILLGVAGSRPAKTAKSANPENSAQKSSRVSGGLSEANLSHTVCKY